MNERIKELMEQANGSIWLAGRDHRKMVLFSEADVEKFAELIVKECAYTADYVSSPGRSQGEVIKRHFGVTE